MKIEEQVVAIKQAKRLKELGVTQSGVFMHVCIMPDPTGERWDYGIFMIDQYPETLCEDIASAFTVAELSVMLNDLVGLVIYDKTYDKWISGIGSPYYPTEAQAKAHLLIELLESEDDYFNPTIVNQRLTK